MQASELRSRLFKVVPCGLLQSLHRVRPKFENESQLEACATQLTGLGAWIGTTVPADDTDD